MAVQPSRCTGSADLRATPLSGIPMVFERREVEHPADGPQSYTIPVGLLAFSITAILLFAPVLAHLLGRLAAILAW